MKYNSKPLRAFQSYVLRRLPELNIGDTVKIVVYLELPSEIFDMEKQEKERTQTYTGVIIACHDYNSNFNIDTKHPIPTYSTITVRKMFQSGASEKIFVFNSPWIKSIEVLNRSKVRRSKLYYLRQRSGKSARLKRRLK